MGQTFSKTPSNDLCGTFSLLFSVLRKPACITKISRKLFLKSPPCAMAETEGVNLVVIETYRWNFSNSFQNLFWPSPFFFLFSVDRPTQVFKKKSLRRRQWHIMTLFPTIVTLIWNKQFLFNMFVVVTSLYFREHSLCDERDFLSVWQENTSAELLYSFLPPPIRLFDSCSLPVVSWRQRRIPGTQGKGDGSIPSTVIKNKC